MTKCLNIFVLFCMVSLTTFAQEKKHTSCKINTSVGAEFYKSGKPSTDYELGLTSSKLKDLSLGATLSHKSKPNSTSYFSFVSNASWQALPTYNIGVEGNFSLDYEKITEESFSVNNKIKVVKNVDVLLGYDFTHNPGVFMHGINPGTGITVNERVSLKTIYYLTLTRFNKDLRAWSHAGYFSVSTKINNTHNLKTSLDASQKYSLKKGTDSTLVNSYYGKLGLGLSSKITDYLETSVKTSFKLKNDLDFSNKISFGLTVAF